MSVILIISALICLSCALIESMYLICKGIVFMVDDYHQRAPGWYISAVYIIIGIMGGIAVGVIVAYYW